MSKKTKKTEEKSQQRYTGAALKNSKYFSGDDYWLAQIVLVDDKYYTIEEAMAVTLKAKNEKVI